jgi:hypothetical protein
MKASLFPLYHHHTFSLGSHFGQHLRQHMPHQIVPAETLLGDFPALMQKLLVRDIERCPIQVG